MAPTGAKARQRMGRQLVYFGPRETLRVRDRLRNAQHPDRLQLPARRKRFLPGRVRRRRNNRRQPEMERSERLLSPYPHGHQRPPGRRLRPHRVFGAEHRGRGCCHIPGSSYVRTRLCRLRSFMEPDRRGICERRGNGNYRLRRKIHVRTLQRNDPRKLPGSRPPPAQGRLHQKVHHALHGLHADRGRRLYNNVLRRLFLLQC